MHWLRFAGVILIATVLQLSNVLDLIALTRFNIKPDLLLILMVFFAIHCKTHDAIITAFVIGFAADMCGGVLGSHIISYGLLGSLLAYIRQMIVIKKMVQQAATIFVIGVSAGLLVQFVSALKANITTENVYMVLAGNSLYSAAIGPYLCSAAAIVAGWLGVKKYRYGSAMDR